jgi:hypothetical protein
MFYNSFLNSLFKLFLIMFAVLIIRDENKLKFNINPKTQIMAYTHSDKRDFVRKLVNITIQSSDILKAKGYDTESKIAELISLADDADKKEAAQEKAQAAATKATELTVEAMDKAYNVASATIELFVGLLGKDDTLVHELKKIRKVHNAPKKSVEA